jgi:hypothetical protein
MIDRKDLPRARTSSVVTSCSTWCRSWIRLPSSSTMRVSLAASPASSGVMVALPLLRVCTGVTSARQIERRTHEDVAFRVRGFRQFHLRGGASSRSSASVTICANCIDFAPPTTPSPPEARSSAPIWRGPAARSAEGARTDEGRQPSFSPLSSDHDFEALWKTASSNSVEVGAAVDDRHLGRGHSAVAARELAGVEQRRRAELSAEIPGFPRVPLPDAHVEALPPLHRHVLR